jgi:tetratricopeptide (TPR) repeat protein
VPRAQIDDDRIVREVVTSLTGGEPGAERAALRQQMEQAAREFDSLAAATLCKALLERLTERPDDVRELETLLILGLAHPNVLQEHRIPLVQEGRRLAILLERQGEPERAQSLLELLCGQCPEDRGLDRELAGMLRRSGSTDRLVERYLRRAEEAMREGRRNDAVRWLREVLLVDRSRRDVARMIRDLGFEQVARRKAWLFAGKVAVGVALLAALAWAEVDRERALLAEYEAIPPAMPGEVSSLRGRLAAIDEMVDANAPWIGIFAASHERAELRAAIARIGSAEAEALAVHADEQAHQATQAESARLRGRLAAERGDFAAARGELEQALELAPADWPHRVRVQADVDAIVSWQAENRGRTAEVRR